MSITERAQKVLAEIKERRAVIARATPGPWSAEYYDVETTRLYYRDSTRLADFAVRDGTRKHPDATFIVASRNERDTELQCLETVIEGFFEVESYWQDSEHSKIFRERALAALFDQWEGSK
jgi:hypothetical protein